MKKCSLLNLLCVVILSAAPVAVSLEGLAAAGITHRLGAKATPLTMPSPSP